MPNEKDKKKFSKAETAIVLQYFTESCHARMIMKKTPVENIVEKRKC